MVYSSGLDDVAHRRYHRNVLKSAIRFPRSVAGSRYSPAMTLQDGSILYVVLNSSPRTVRSVADAAGKAAASELVGFGAFERADVAMVGAVQSDWNVRGGASVRRSMCGVRLLWVKDGMRLRGIATALVDVARRSLVYAHVFPHSYVSFSPPTPSGARFALRYAPQRVKRRNSRTAVDKAKQTCTEEHREMQKKKEPGNDEGDAEHKSTGIESVLGYILVYKPESELHRTCSRSIDESES
eukprot:IDg10751t1